MKKWIFLAILIASFIIVPCQTIFGAAEQDKAVTAGGGKAYFEIYDEDDMSSDDPYGFATQQSIKAYCDDAARTISGVRNHDAALVLSGVSKSPTALVGFEIDPDDGNLFLIDTSAPGISLQKCGDGQGPSDDAGVTVVLKPPSAELHGWEGTFMKADSGASDFFLWAPWVADGTQGYAFDSGTTDNKTLDAQYDWITVQCYWINSGDSGYLIKGYGNK